MFDSLKESRNLVIMGLMLALTIIFDLTPLGAIPLGIVSATITHLPTIIIGVIIGPVAGMLMGLMFGVITLLHALTRPMTILDPLFVNPLISVLPRMLIGVSSYYVYKLLEKMMTNKTVPTFVAGVMGSITNTVLVLGMLVLVYGKKVTEMVGSSALKWAVAIATTNGIIEAIVAGFFVMVITGVYFKLEGKED